MAAPVISEEKKRIMQELQKFLPITSPFAVWESEDHPVIEVDKNFNRFRVLPEIEAHYLAGKFYLSDFYYLMAGACYRYSTSDAIYLLIEFWRRKEVRDATEEKRKQLNIPNPETSISTRMKLLCREGLMVRYDLFPNPAYYKLKNGSDALIDIPFFRTTANGNTVYSASLEKNPVSFNTRIPFYSEAEQMRWLNNSILTAAFLGLPWVRDVKFSYTVKVDRKSILLMSYLKIQNGSQADYNCHLILESVSLRTNENIVTVNSRKEEMVSRVTELVTCMQELEKQTGKPHFLVFNLENLEALVLLQKIILSIRGINLEKKILVTTGTILYAKQIVEKRQFSEMASAFLEFNGSTFTGANYYFLQEFEAEGNQVVTAEKNAEE